MAPSRHFRFGPQQIFRSSTKANTRPNAHDVQAHSATVAGANSAPRYADGAGLGASRTLVPRSLTWFSTFRERGKILRKYAMSRFPRQRWWPHDPNRGSCTAPGEVPSRRFLDDPRRGSPSATEGCNAFKSTWCPSTLVDVGKGETRSFPTFSLLLFARFSEFQ